MSQFSNDAVRRQWVEGVSSPSAEGCIRTLRQIAAAGHVLGLSAAIVRLAGSSDDEVRLWSAEVLESCVVPSPDETPELMALLGETEDSEVCYWAVTMLGRLGRDAEPAVASLEKCLGESLYLPARERAAWALSQIGAAAAPAMPTLRRTALSGPPRLQRLAIQALEAIRGVAA